MVMMKVAPMMGCSWYGGGEGTNKGDADDGKCLIICQRFSADWLCGKKRKKKTPRCDDGDEDDGAGWYGGI